MKCSKSHTEDPQISSATVQNLVAVATGTQDLRTLALINYAHCRSCVVHLFFRFTNIECRTFVCSFVCFLARKPPVDHGLLINEVSRSQKDAPRAVGLLWTSDQLVVETSIWQHTTLTTDRHPCSRWDSNWFRRDPARKLSANLYDLYHCCVYSEKLLMMDRGTVRNM